MNRLDVSVTSIGLLGSVVFPTVDVFRNLVLANSVAGFCTNSRRTCTYTS